MTANKLPSILTIAGSDSGGGAGIQADIKTITMLGGYGMSAITAVTAQNTLEVSAVQPLSTTIVRAQIEAVVSDIGVDVIKTGMLHNAAIIEVVMECVSNANVPLVVDPVMVSSSGHALLDAEAVSAMRELIAHATLVTPNLPEAEALAAGYDRHALLEALRCHAVLLKGGHGDGVICEDWLFETGKEGQCFTQPRLDTRHTHGTGCTLSAAIATFLGRGNTVEESVRQAQAYVHQAITHAPGFGAGHGPLAHQHPLNM